MFPAYLYLAGAIASEIIATLSLRASEGFAKRLFIPIVILGYAAAFTLLAFALRRGLHLGVAYAVWSGVGVAAIAVLGVLLFDEQISLIQVCGLILLIAGVVALELGGEH